MRTCGVLIYRGGFVTCGLRANYNLKVGGDLLFAVCHRHDRRLKRAFPGMETRS